MLRASSEIAVVMRTCSVVENPDCSARIRPRRRAVTMSPSVRMFTSDSTSSRCGTFTLMVLGMEEGEALLEIEGRRDVFEDEPELHHREGDLGLDAHDDRVGAAQADHVRDVGQR